MSPQNRVTIPEGNESFTEEDFQKSTERGHRLRKQVLKNNKVAAEAGNRLYSEIAQRVETLRALRKARGLTQQQLANELQITQAEISRMERRENLHLTTLSRFIEATGGKLRITAIYQDSEVEVTVGDLLETTKPEEPI